MNEYRRYKFGILVGMRNSSAACFIGNADGVFRDREIRRLEPRSRSHQQRNWSTVVNDRRQMDMGQTRNSNGPDPDPAIAIEGAPIHMERITKQDIDDFGATVGCPDCNAITDNKQHNPNRIVAECELKNASG